MLTREAALALIQAQNPEAHMLQHAQASEAVMRALARHFGEDEDLWGLTGLLHDLDYPQTKDSPERHGLVSGDILDGRMPEAAVRAIKAHNGFCTGCPPESRFGFALRAAETVTGLVTAAALVRPTGMEGMEAKSLKKKMKDKAFAAAVNRETIRECEQIGLPLDDFLSLAITAMTEMRA